MPARRSTGLDSRASDWLLRSQAADLSRNAGASPGESSAGASKIAKVGLTALETPHLIRGSRSVHGDGFGTERSPGPADKDETEEAREVEATFRVDGRLFFQNLGD